MKFQRSCLERFFFFFKIQADSHVLSNCLMMMKSGKTSLSGTCYPVGAHPSLVFIRKDTFGQNERIC